MIGYYVSVKLSALDYKLQEQNHLGFNGLVERHNLALSEILNKVLEKNRCSHYVVPAWCLNLRNSLLNVYDFSPF